MSNPMSLSRAIAKNTLIQFAGKAISVLLGLVAVALMTRTLGVEKFGWYVTVTGFLQFVGLLCDFGFTIITANMLSEPRFEKTKLLNNLFTWRFITAFVFHALAPIIILFFPYPAPIKIAVLITTFSFFFIALNNIFIGYCQANLKMSVQMIGEVLGRIFLVVGLLLISWGNYGFLPTMIIITLASAVYTFYLWIRVERASPYGASYPRSLGEESKLSSLSPRLIIKFETDREISKAIFYKMWPTALSVIFNAFYLQGDRVLLPLFVSQADVGIYGAAYRILDIITQSAAMIMGIMMPLVSFSWSRGLLEEFKKRYQISFNLVLLLLVPIMAGIFVLAEPIMQLVAGKEFVGSGEILRLLSFAVLGIAVGNVFGYLALAIGRQKKSLIIFASDAFLTTILYFVLIPKFGIYGAAWAAVFSELFAGVGLMLVCNYYSKIRLNFYTALKILLASAIMGWVVYVFQPLNLFVSILLGIIIYGALVLILKIISKETLLEVLAPQPKIGA